MQINFTGHGMEVTPALRDLTTAKLEKIVHHFDPLTINVTFFVEKLSQIAEANIHLAGHEIHARAEADDMYKTVDLLIGKLKRQLAKIKEKNENHRE